MKIALVAGEASGDLLGASLMQSLKNLCADVQFIGVGGEQMQQEGLASFFPLEKLSVMGISEVLSKIPELLSLRKQLFNYLKQEQPDVMIGIDAPDFNLDLELKLRKSGIKTVHYVSPSVWAWRQNRVHKIKKACDLILTLLPFEADFYQQENVPVKFVGHPLADQIIPLAKDDACDKLNLPQDKKIIALFPGSRAGEVEKLADIFLQAGQLIHQNDPDTHLVLSCANFERLEQIMDIAVNYAHLPLTVVVTDSHKVMSACDAAIAASGTVTLEIMLHQKPMVVAYRLSNVSYWLLKKMVRTPFISLPNLLANQQLVPELIQKEATADNISGRLWQVLANPQEQTGKFSLITDVLKQNASKQAATAILELC